MLRAEPKNSPRVEGQQADVAPASPLAVVALFTEVVRQRFRPENELAWVWTPNPTPSSGESNTPDAPRKILIEPAFNTQVQVRNFRPAIFIDRGDVSAHPVTVNNVVHTRLTDMKEWYYTIATMPIEIEAVSGSKGESATLADLVWFYLLAGRRAISSTFGLHEISNPTLGGTVPFESDQKAWSTRVSLVAQIHLRWSVTPIAPLMAGVTVNYRASDASNMDEFLLRQYLP